MDGPMRLPKNKEEHLRVVRTMYDTWFAIWRDAYVPHLLHQPKWFDSDKDLLPGDLVYFLKQENKLASKWIIGMVEDVTRGSDGVLREVKVKYCNAFELMPYRPKLWNIRRLGAGHWEGSRGWLVGS